MLEPTNMLPYMVKELCRCDFIKDLELRRSSWIYPSRPNIIAGVLRRERDGRIRIRSGQKQRSQGCDRWLWRWKGPEAKGIQQPLKTAKGKEADSLLECPAISSQWDSFWTSNYCKRISLRWFEAICYMAVGNKYNHVQCETAPVWRTRIVLLEEISQCTCAHFYFCWNNAKCVWHLEIGTELL